MMIYLRGGKERDYRERIGRVNNVIITNKDNKNNY